jgi:hypothetical protein
VTSVAKKSDTHARPLALNTVQLLKAGSAAFGMSPQQTVGLGTGIAVVCFIDPDVVLLFVYVNEDLGLS